VGTLHPFCVLLHHSFTLNNKLSMMNIRILFGALSILFLWTQCTPKTTQKTTQPDMNQQKKESAKLDSIMRDPCRTWNELPNKDEIIEMHVIYRDFITSQNYKEAFPYWERVFAAAPRADGRRWTHFEDGLTLYNDKYQKAQSTSEKENYLHKMKDIVELWKSCSSQGGNIARSAGELAFTLFYNYRDVFGDTYIYSLFKEAVDHAQDTLPVYIFNPFSRLLVDMVKSEKIDNAEASTIVVKLLNGLQKGIQNCQGEECKSWDIVKSYTPDVLAHLERIRGFFDCDYYKKKYLARFEEDSTSCDVIDEVFLKLRWAGCDENDPEVARVIRAKSTHCKVMTKNPDLLAASQSLEGGKFNEAIQHYKKYLQSSSDNTKKAKIAFRIAQVYYAYLKNYPKARKYALQAAKLKPGWGNPYLLIGTLYASSGPLCGSGRGWNSQMVVWPAIDKWNYAKKIDPSVASKANHYIHTYQQYMPDYAEIHQRLLKPGQKIKVGCWINETTTIRPAP